MMQVEIPSQGSSGRQVFKADSAEELIQELVTAQMNATRKIHKQSQELGAVEETALCLLNLVSEVRDCVSSRLPAESLTKIDKIITDGLTAAGLIG